MARLLPPALLHLQLVAAGVTLQVAFHHLLRRRRQPANRSALWFSVTSLGLAAALLGNVWTVHASPDRVDAGGVVRASLLAMALVLQVIATRQSVSTEASERDLAARTEEAVARLARAERQSRLALQAGGMGWYEWTSGASALEVSAEACEILGRASDEPYLSLTEILERVHADDLADGGQAMLELPQGNTCVSRQLRWLRPDGTTVWLETFARSVVENGQTKVIGTVHDITLQKRHEADLLHRAQHDTLTGLPNRAALTVVLQDELRKGTPFSLLLLDLDGFKDVNDTLGHSVGDKVLIHVSRRLTRSVGSEQLACRLGGDEFAIVVRGGPATATGVADEVLRGLESPIEIDRVEITVRASIGIATSPGDGTDAETLLRRADSAMYRAKERGGRWLRFTAGHEGGAARRLALTGQLASALAGDQVEVHYQPTVDLVSGGCRAVEALVRWRHPDLGVVSPAELIPLAEHYGHGPALARYVIKHALGQCHSWREAGLADVVAVNVSAHTLVDASFVCDVADALAAIGLPGDALVLEITENMFADESSELLSVLLELRGLGVRLAIDDFGTGYSSLGYLERLPVDILKLDRAFTAGLGGDTANDAIVALTVELAHRLGLTVVAEGVETADTLAVLGGYGCDEAQGYWICHPLPPDAFASWLASREVSALR